uniref:Galectin n=1 Tax=Parascaris equorum TaxID=6256 RepID=A0A914RJ20_PAREQ
MDISQFIRYRAPIRIHKIFRRKLLCFSKTNTSITIELEKAAFVQGERIMVHGQILNENPSNPNENGRLETTKICNMGPNFLGEGMRLHKNGKRNSVENKTNNKPNLYSYNVVSRK